MNTLLSHFIAPALLRLIDYPIGLDVVERRTDKGSDREIRARYPENGVLLKRAPLDSDDRQRELYLSRSGRFLLFESQQLTLPSGAEQIIREFSHELNGHERFEDWLDDRELLAGLRDIFTAKIARSQEKIQVLTHQQRKIDQLLKKEEALAP